MPRTIRFFFSFIFLCGIFSTSRGAGLKCDSLFALGNYFEASIEYERLIFNGNHPDLQNTLRFKKAMCFKKMLKFDRALEELQPIYLSNSADTLHQLVAYEQSVCLYLSGEPNKALWKIDQFLHDKADTVSLQNFLPIRILCLNEAQKWEDAKENMLQFIEMQHFAPEKKDELDQTVNRIYHRKNLPHLRSVRKAENLSRFLPGSGQIYAGKSGEGAVNFLINASLLAFTAYEAYHGFFITGYFAGLGFFNKTYHGGIRRSGILAARKNKELMANFNREVNTTIRSCLN